MDCKSNPLIVAHVIAPSVFPRNRGVVTHELMQISAEIRWFWSNALPPKLEEWFRNGTSNACPAGGGEPRVDEYLYDGVRSNWDSNVAVESEVLK